MFDSSRCAFSAYNRKTHALFEDVEGRDSKELSVLYNGIIVFTFSSLVFVLLLLSYVKTNNRLILSCAITILVILILATLSKSLAICLQIRQKQLNTINSVSVTFILFPAVINSLILPITNFKTIGYVYRCLKTPERPIIMILVLAVILIYALAVLFCHYSNVYCIIATIFAKKNVHAVEEKLTLLRKKNEIRETVLRQLAEYVDKEALQVGFWRRTCLTVRFLCGHISAFYQERILAVKYLFLFFYLKVSEKLSGLLDVKQIKTNWLRFCEITVMLELLILDMLLFIHLGSDNPCSRFYELLSTVVIIPILLSSLASLKTKNKDGYA